jgi:hypothetical protein
VVRIRSVRFTGFNGVVVVGRQNCIVSAFSDCIARKHLNIGITSRQKRYHS